MSLSTNRILFISNGHGEDTIACGIIDCLSDNTTGVEVHAWPMVGSGDSYSCRGIGIVGESSVLPGGGFSLSGIRALLSDIRAGLLMTTMRQYRAASKLRGQYTLTIAVGDIVPIIAAQRVGSPFLFIACAKSAYYSASYGFNRLEKRLLRKHCRLTFTRDAISAKELESCGVACKSAGNPMMDGLKASSEDINAPQGGDIVGLLPGSRSDAPENAILLLQAAAHATHIRGLEKPLLYIFAATNDFDMDYICRSMPTGWKVAPSGDVKGVVLTAMHENGATAWFIKGRFADVLHYSKVVIGVAGTANEQAIGLGKPLITFPTRIMNRRYVDMKMQLFGEAALKTLPESETIARELVDLLNDAARREKMGSIGRERMGGPGASAVIADEIMKTMRQLI
jgi:uncharacterized protein (TIGR03492 family)